ncbi:hypothetical protein B0T11DRAFT_286405 [Plectosphaerella cucumerina]|uniref:BZIP domain-containing protein n=1 Tax=Plectosphaerella cucumerina TaxID=40658 RepID=A0A8K0TD38_9PEZI|nr:hypothetical protein B0T11DRAFT_286405 [Plectosphaerella cucumerina]
MPQLHGISVLKDDWSGVTSTAERKKRPNRLNQRAFRERSKRQPAQSGQKVLMNKSPEPHVVRRRHNPSHSGHLLPPCPRKSSSIQALRMQAYQGWALNAPRPSQLQFLIRLNVLDALARNALAIGFPVEGLCADHFDSPFTCQGPGPNPESESDVFTGSLQSLAPTVLQRTVRHHPWIDLFPLPRFRDNILLALEAGVIDEDELCGDLLNVEDANRSTDTKPSLLVWGEPSDARGWEASITFLRKWAWLAQGCPELVEGTNHWRTKRGEKRLVIDLGREELTTATSDANCTSTMLKFGDGADI